MSTPTAVQLLRNSLDRFLAQDMKGWAELCDEDVVAKFPFAPEGSPDDIYCGDGRNSLRQLGQVVRLWNETPGRAM